MMPSPRPTGARCSGAPSTPRRSRPRRRSMTATTTPSRGCAGAELLAQHPRGAALERPHHLCRRVGRPDRHEQVHAIGHHFLGHDLPATLAGDLLQQLAQPSSHPPAQNPAPILGAPHHMQPQRVHPSRGATKPALRHTLTVRNGTDKPSDPTLVTSPDSPDG